MLKHRHSHIPNEVLVLMTNGFHFAKILFFLTRQIKNNAHSRIVL